jgi:hypothetical protein
LAGQPVINNPGVAGTTFTPTALQALTPGRAYTWYVGAISTNGASFTNLHNFTTTSGFRIHAWVT